MKTNLTEDIKRHREYRKEHFKHEVTLEDSKWDGPCIIIRAAPNGYQFSSVCLTLEEAKMVAKDFNKILEENS